MPDECGVDERAVHVNNAPAVAFQRLSRSGSPGEAAVKRFATTLLVAGLMATPVLVLPPPSVAAVDVSISVGIAPPPLPVYAQPVVPGPGYMWIPGYWAWGGGDYYWVPGTWVLPPAVGLLWTPGWWGWSGGFYRWHPGYWGRQVGYYGGIDYGHGYFGTGYVGDQWRGREFYYNRAVTNINVRNVHNVYVNRTVVENVHVSRVSYNGGRGGIVSRPSPAQRQRESRHHVAPTPMQVQHRESAVRNPAQRFSAGPRHPETYATQRINGPASNGNHRPGANPRRERAAPQRNPQAAHARDHGERKHKGSDHDGHR